MGLITAIASARWFPWTKKDGSPETSWLKYIGAISQGLEWPLVLILVPPSRWKKMREDTNNSCEDLEKGITT